MLKENHRVTKLQILEWFAVVAIADVPGVAHAQGGLVSRGVDAAGSRAALKGVGVAKDL